VRIEGDLKAQTFLIIRDVLLEGGEKYDLYRNTPALLLRIRSSLVRCLDPEPALAPMAVNIKRMRLAPVTAMIRSNF